MKKYNLLKHNKGYITLLSVLVVGVVGMSITVSIILLGLGSSRSSFNYQQMHQAKSLANACTEEGLEKIREASSFAGNGNLTLGQGSCTYSVVNTGGNNRTVNAAGTAGTTIRKTSVNITAISPLIIISSWQEIQ